MSKKISMKAAELVVGQMINMFKNNFLEDNGSESFEGWCEDGDVFWDFAKDESDQPLVEECIRIMQAIALQVDTITEKIDKLTRVD